MRKNRPGYPLPSGTLGEDDITCQLVYLPDRPEYWQAFLASYHYLTTWLAWEGDAAKRGKDAASNWRDAFEMTMECWRMPCLDEIKELLTQLIAAQCCESNLFTQLPSPIAPNTGTPIQYNEGTEPDEYGDVVITDWDDWAEYKCEAAHFFVELVAQKFDDLSDLFDTYDAGVVSIEMIGWVVSKLATLGFIALAWDVFAAIRDWAWESIGDFSGAAAEIRAASDDIACAISKGDGALDCAARFEAACKVAVTGAPGDLVLGGMPWEAWANIIYTGIGVDNEGTEVYLTDLLDAPGTNACCGPTKIVLHWGDSISGYHPVTGNSKFTDQAHPLTDFERCNIQFFEFDGTTPKLVSLTKITMTPLGSNEKNGGTYSLHNLGGAFYDSDTPPTLPLDVHLVSVVDSRADLDYSAVVEFDLELEWEEI